MNRLRLFALAALLTTGLAACDFFGGDDEPAFSDLLYPVQLDGKWGFINGDGRISVIPEFDNARDFSENLAAVQVGGVWGYVSNTGQLVAPPQYQVAGKFSEGRAFVRGTGLEDLYGYIDTDGQVIRSVDTPDLMAPEEPHFSAGLALVRDEDEDEYGYINKNAEPVIPLQYPSARAFSDGLAAVKISDRWGYISPNQETVINPRYIEAGNFSEGMAPVRENTNTWGFVNKINKKGTLVIEPQFDDARAFSEGLAAVQLYGLWGFVNKSGQMVADPQFEEVGDFDRGLARISVELPDPERDDRTIMRYGYIDRDGAYVWYPTN